MPLTGTSRLKKSKRYRRWLAADTCIERTKENPIGGVMASWMIRNNQRAHVPQSMGRRKHSSVECVHLPTNDRTRSKNEFLLDTISIVSAQWNN